MTHFANVMQRMFNTPVMIRQEKAEMIVAALADRLGIASLQRMDGSAMTSVEMNAMAAVGRRERRVESRMFDVVDNVAWIPISGTLVHKLGSLDPYSGMTGYDGIMTKVRSAMADEDVRAIWLDIDSPGGEVSGCFDTAREIAAYSKRSGGKPIWAMCNETACSAAYAIASAADKVFAPETSVVGSIGVYILFVDWTKALDKDGIAVQFIRSGTKKARGSGYEAIDADTIAKLQASVDETREMFVRLVASNRRLTQQKVRDTEADWYGGNAALNLGLIDGVMSEVEAFSKLQQSLARAG